MLDAFPILFVFFAKCGENEQNKEMSTIAGNVISCGRSSETE